MLPRSNGTPPSGWRTVERNIKDVSLQVFLREKLEAAEKKLESVKPVFTAAVSTPLTKYVRIRYSPAHETATTISTIFSM